MPRRHEVSGDEGSVAPVLDEWDQGFFRHYPEECGAYIDETLALVRAQARLDARMNELVKVHSIAEAHNPYEPYNGVQALFNGDLHLRAPNYAPRNHWEVVSAYEIRHLPVWQILAERDEEEPNGQA